MRSRSESLWYVPGFLTLCLIQSGCIGSNDPAGLPVTGNVRIDGRPIESGKIILEHVDGKSAAVATIDQGVFRFRTSDGARPGTYRVAVHSERKTGRTVPHPDLYGETLEEIVEAVPPEFNVRSKLTAEIREDQDNTIELSLVTPVEAKKRVRRR